METLRDKALNLLMECKTREDIDIVSQELRDRWNAISQKLARAAQAGLEVGDAVYWTSRKRFGAVLEGVVLGLMPKNVKVRTQDGVVWTVHPTLLRKGRKAS